MIWNTIAHPKMMTSGDTVPPEPAPGVDDTTESVVEGIKYADPHKLAFFDLLVDMSELNNPKLIHGDFETVKNKILNHELVIAAIVSYGSLLGNTSQMVQVANVSYSENNNNLTIDNDITLDSDNNFIKTQ